MKNLLVKIMFDGRNYSGFQMQINAPTIQFELEKAIQKITGSRCIVYGCSRTDSGVSANEYFFNFHTDSAIPAERVFHALNRHLPPAISAVSCTQVDENFHARYHAIKKEYIYKIWNERIKNPFEHGFCHYYPYNLNDIILNEECKSFIGTHDFSSFMSQNSTVKTTVRTVYEAGMERDGSIVIFRVCADGFLYNMVRIMVGTLLKINEGRIKRGSIPQIIEAKYRNSAGDTAPPYGLFLNKVYYSNMT